MTALVKRLRDKTRLRKTHGLTGWVLQEEQLTDEAADEIERLYENRDYWMASCQEAQKSRDTASVFLAASEAEIERLRGLLRWWLTAGGADEDTIREALGHERNQ